MSFFANTSRSSMPPPRILGIDPDKTATNEFGRVVPYVVGKQHVGVTFISEPWEVSTSPIQTEVGKDTVTTGYNYYASFAGVLCLGPIDEVHEIKFDEQVVWTGSLTPGVGDYETITIEGRGDLRLYWGTETQAVDSDLNGSGTTHPAYRGQAYFVALDFLLGDNAQVPNMTFLVSRYPSPAWLTADAQIEDDSSPVAVFGDLWESKRYGLGLSSDLLDTDAINITGENLETAGVGISCVLSTAEEWENFLARLFECFDGYLKVDSEGLLSVLWNQYQVGGTPPTFDEDDLVEEPELDSTGWPDTINEAIVSFQNAARDFQRDSVSWVDRGNFETQGRIKTTTLQRPWITRQEVAYRIAGSYCRQNALPRISGSITIRGSSLGDLEPGSTFYLTHTASGLAALECRVLEILVESPDSPDARISFVEDRGRLNDDDYTPPDDTPTPPTTYTPANIYDAEFKETPYGFQRDVHCHFQMLVARGDTITTSIRSWNLVAPGSYEPYRATKTPALKAKLEGTLSIDGFCVDEDNGLEVTFVSPDKTPKVTTKDEALRGRSLLFIGNEVFVVWNATLVSPDRYSFSYIRAAYACEKEEHADQAEAWLWFQYTEDYLLTVEYGEVAIKSFYWKFVAHFLGINSALADATQYAMTSTLRAYLPLRPINLTANGDGYNPTFSTGGTVVVDWDLASPERNFFPVEEDRETFADAVKIQILDVSTETVQWEDEVDEVGPHTISNAEIVAALTTEQTFLLRVYTQRAGYDSLTYAQLKVYFV